MKATLLDQICELYAESVEVDYKKAPELRRLMKRYRSMNGTRHSPAFKKLWDAIEETVDSAHIEYGLVRTTDRRELT
jgi:hypothetical protein